MKKATASEINKLAKQFNKDNKKWHFHLLTPTCKLNKSKSHAFILEDSTDKKIYVAYSKKPLMKLGKELVKLLHKVLSGNAQKQTKMSKDGKKIFQRAKELNKQSKYWHHHMLFPDCIYNDSGKWMIFFEDQEKGKVIKALSQKEPKADLEQIEKLYYQQEDLK